MLEFFEKHISPQVSSINIYLSIFVYINHTYMYISFYLLYCIYLNLAPSSLSFEFFEKHFPPQVSFYLSTDLNIQRVFIKYCAFSKILNYISDSGISRFPFGVSVRSRNCRVQKNHNILRKNTIFNEHPVLPILFTCIFEHTF